MSLMNDPDVKRILDTARVMTRQERETAILQEIERLGGQDILQLNLQNTLGVDDLKAVQEDDFDFAALLSWKLIYSLRVQSGILH